MRLLDVNTLTFSEFYSQIPRYVIASHRWVAGAEVMLTSMQAGTRTNSYGYRKVKGFAEYVKTHMPDVSWLWIDTCCIDQKSSTELSEAINSMFRWYRNAEVCLAYLHDVPVAANMANFQESSWFRRGWTLQELLAPSVVVFLSQDWQIIGHKGRGSLGQNEMSIPVGPMLNDRIAEITHIPKPILRDYEASHALSVEEKLEWMANRQTTREEDLSYCLLGILDVYMNIRYGDGLERTRERLYRKAQSRHNKSPGYDYQSTRRAQSPGLGSIATNEIAPNRPIAVPEILPFQTGSEGRMALIRRWLSPPPIDSVNGKNLQDRAPGSCKWITRTNAYREWLSNNAPHDLGKVFWIHGPAGMGKSVLNADMIHDLVTHEKQIVASYFTSARNVGHLESILRSWLEQCAELDPVAQAIILSFVPQQRPGATVSSEELWTALKSVASAAGRRIFALDGFDQFARNFDFRKAFLERLLDTFATGQARVLITSRDERDLRSALYPTTVTDARPTILEHRVTPPDVQADVTALTRTVLLQKIPALLQEERDSLVIHIVKRCDGMFSWLGLLESRLSSGQGADEVRNIADNTVSELDATYRQKLQSIGRENPETRECAGKVLAWVMYASTQMSINELCKALGSTPSRVEPRLVTLDKIVNMFDGLLQERSSDPTDPTGIATIDFVHSSLRHCLAARLHDYGPDESLSWIMIEHDAHLYLTRLCIDRLDGAWPLEWSEVTDSRPQAHLLRYAAEFWHAHASALPSQGFDLCTLFEKFLSLANPNFVAWSTFFENDTEIYDDWQTRPADTPPPLYYAARLNLSQIMVSFKEKWIPAINQVGGSYGTALQSVCAKGHMQAFDLLMGWNADVSVKAGRHGSAVHAAAASGNEKMVFELAAKNAHLFIPNAAGRTPLHNASRWGQAGMVKFFAEKGANISTVDDNGWTPLHEASNFGSPELVRFLTTKGVRVSAVTNDDWTPLALASYSGYVEIAKILLENGASISTADKDGRSALFIASENGQLEMVKFLTSRGADVSTAIDTGLSAVNQASSQGHLEIVKFLVQQGANISAATSHGHTPLYNAANEGHLEVVSFLAENGADISARNKLGCTPVYAASYHGHLKVVEFLFSKGADILAETDNGSTPLSSACAGGHLEEVRFLVGKGADVSAKGEKTPINSASAGGHAKIVEFLIDKGVDISVANVTGTRPVMAAAQNGHLELVKQLVDRGAGISSPDKNGFTALHLATFGEHPEVVRFLASKGADVSAATATGRTPLHTAADKGNLDLVKLLVENGANVSKKDANGKFPVANAIEKGHNDVVQYFQHPDFIKTVVAVARQKDLKERLSKDGSSIEGSSKEQSLKEESLKEKSLIEESSRERSSKGEPSKEGSMGWSYFKHRVKQMGKH